MLLESYRNFIETLIDATKHNKLHWSRGTSPSSFLAVADKRVRILIDTYNAQVDNSVNSCINLAIFDGLANIPVEEMVVCEQAGQADDYYLISELYQLVKEQYSNKAVSPILAEISLSLR